MTIHSRNTSLKYVSATDQHFSVPLVPSPRRPFYNTVGKRILDILLCILCAPFAVTLILLAVLLIASDGGKPLYSQMRVGKGGRLFRLWKLRSMVVDADEKFEAYLSGNPDARDEWDKDQKLKNDPRITRLGAMLRRTSIDELPQLWNVLRGDMSLVGPRPMLPEQRVLYPGTAYYSLRPGITGNWQVSDRNQSAFADRANFDNVYSRKVSLGTDIGILAATVRVVLKATGY